eukprot:TRINITY_DN28445_c0_g1_i1.p1 TRINITY_DN28445_c0_g1~~TRINITY_DN28445_c0_g1_i1.p1  ORF type:complete len:154 (+),score=44.58 TRINITY_DN28445_c0_g1_i1:3-464(+)
MYESSEIISYLWHTYGDEASQPWSYRLANLGPLKYGTMFAGLFRLLPQMGMLRIPSRRPERPLEFWNVEASPCCRMVREALCSLEIPYVAHNVPSGLSHSLHGAGWLSDPNTGVNMSDTRRIVEYLNGEYKICLLYTSPSPRDRTRSRMPSSA